MNVWSNCIQCSHWENQYFNSMSEIEVVQKNTTFFSFILNYYVNVKQNSQASINTLIAGGIMRAFFDKFRLGTVRQSIRIDSAICTSGWKLTQPEHTAHVY